MRHQQRARDRRRRHDQHVGAAAAALGLQREALMHAEAVLLVDDGEGEIVEDHVGLEQRVRADEDVDLAAARAASRISSRALPFSRPVSRPMRRPAFSASGAIVSTCWRASTSVGAIRAACAPASTAIAIAISATDRLARADVALQQAQHAVWRRHVGRDLGKRLHAASWSARTAARPRCAGADAAVARARCGPRCALTLWRTRPSASWPASSSS